jgi:sugar phosphate isomerase/epimerase
MRFGVSTHLYHDRRLEREHLAQVAGYGFDTIELFATRSHFDYHDGESIERLARWLSETGLTLGSVHAPITSRFGNGDTWAPDFSNAAEDKDSRAAAVKEAGLALRIAETIPFQVLVLHLGTPASKASPTDNNRASAIRSLQEVCDIAAPLGVRVAAEIIPNRLSDPAALVSMLERDIDARNAGICIDFGHAHVMGDVADAIEIASEHVIATHVHDNHGREDEHLVPGLGTIDWDVALITMQKIGYAGPYLMELRNTGTPATVLEEARRARQRFERAIAGS